MEKKHLLRSFEACLKIQSLGKMSKDLYHFFTLRCGFIAHYDINGFKATYSEPEDFLGFCKTLKEELGADIKNAEWCEDFTDNTDSFKYDYNFNITEVKKEMLQLLNKYAEVITTNCNNKLLEKLRTQREEISNKIKKLFGEKARKHLEQHIKDDYQTDKIPAIKELRKFPRATDGLKERKSEYKNAGGWKNESLSSN